MSKPTAAVDDEKKINDKTSRLLKEQKRIDEEIENIEQQRQKLAEERKKLTKGRQKLTRQQKRLNQKSDGKKRDDRKRDEKKRPETGKKPARPSTRGRPALNTPDFLHPQLVGTTRGLPKLHKPDCGHLSRCDKSRLVTVDGQPRGEMDMCKDCLWAKERIWKYDGDRVVHYEHCPILDPAHTAKIWQVVENAACGVGCEVCHTTEICIKAANGVLVPRIAALPEKKCSFRFPRLVKTPTGGRLHTPQCHRIKNSRQDTWCDVGGLERAKTPMCGDCATVDAKRFWKYKTSAVVHYTRCPVLDPKSAGDIQPVANDTPGWEVDQIAAWNGCVWCGTDSFCVSRPG